MKTKYNKPEIDRVEMSDITMNNSSNGGKPGHGWGAGGHYGPPGQGYDPEHPQKDQSNEEYEYEQELWD